MVIFASVLTFSSTASTNNILGPTGHSTGSVTVHNLLRAIRSSRHFIATLAPANANLLITIGH